MDYRILIRILSLLLFSINLQAQVFVPAGYWRGYSNCTTDYCPTLNPMNAALQGTGGSTQIVSTCIDDNFIGVTLPWDFHMGDVPFRNFFIGSNTYITAGTGSSLYSGLSASVPAFPKFHLGAGDANYQRVYRTNGANYYRVRYEGNSAYGTCGSVNTIYELTFFRPTVNYQYVQIVFGAHGGTGRPFGVASASAWYQTATPITANSSYVIYSTNGGNTWTLLPNYSISGAGTNL